MDRELPGDVCPIERISLVLTLLPENWCHYPKLTTELAALALFPIEMHKPSGILF